MKFLDNSLALKKIKNSLTFLWRVWSLSGPIEWLQLLVQRLTRGWTQMSLFSCRGSNEPEHEIMALFVHRKLILQTRMRSYPVGLDVWFFVRPFVYFHTSCVRTAKALARLLRCAGSPEPSLVAYVISTIISWAGSNVEHFTVDTGDEHTWAATWQNQQCGCVPSEDSDQPGHPPSLIRVFAVRMKKTWVLSYPLRAQWRLLIRLGGCPGWSESSLGAHSFVGFVMSRLTCKVSLFFVTITYFCS